MDLRDDGARRSPRVYFVRRKLTRKPRAADPRHSLGSGADPHRRLPAEDGLQDPRKGNRMRIAASYALSSRRRVPPGLPDACRFWGLVAMGNP